LVRGKGSYDVFLSGVVQFGVNGDGVLASLFKDEIVYNGVAVSGDMRVLSILIYCHCFHLTIFFFTSSLITLLLFSETEKNTDNIRLSLYLNQPVLMESRCSPRRLNRLPTSGIYFPTLMHPYKCRQFDTTLIRRRHILGVQISELGRGAYNTRSRGWNAARFWVVRLVGKTPFFCWFSRGA
jgi:hypothetical protein